MTFPLGPVVAMIEAPLRKLRPSKSNILVSCVSCSVSSMQYTLNSASMDCCSSGLGADSAVAGRPPKPLLLALLSAAVLPVLLAVLLEAGDGITAETGRCSGCCRARRCRRAASRDTQALQQHAQRRPRTGSTAQSQHTPPTCHEAPLQPALLDHVTCSHRNPVHADMSTSALHALQRMPHSSPYTYSRVSCTGSSRAAVSMNVIPISGPALMMSCTYC